MKKKGILIGLSIFCIVTLLLAVYVAENNFPSKVSGGDWISFLGGYFGGIIGAVVSLIVLFFTIENNNSKQELEFKKQNRCFFDFQELYGLNYNYMNQLSEYSKGNDAKILQTDNYEKNIKNISEFKDIDFKLNFIKIVNLGKGSAFNVNIKIEHTQLDTNFKKDIKVFLPFVIQNEHLFINIDHKEFLNHKSILSTLVISYNTLANEEMKLKYKRLDDGKYTTKIYYKENNKLKELFTYGGNSISWLNL